MDQIYGVLLEFSPWSVLVSAVVVVAVGYLGSPLWIWTLALLGVAIGFGLPMPLIILFVGAALLFNLPPLRQMTISALIMKLFKALQFVPTISETERTALEAGVVWAEGELFSGKPDFKKLMSEDYPKLTPEEQAFIDGPVERLCQLADDWEIWEKRELPNELWEMLKKEKFLGMIIPKEYGGLGFSAMAHSEVIMKMASRSLPLSVTVMVPNSLGPAELLVHYGTEEQKRHYLPRLASGQDLPCFALTEPTAGSDAGSIKADGIVFKGDDGKLYLKLNWNKRWITLAAISSVLGLAFRLRDPQNLLGKGEDVGITCALIPTKTPGVIVGRRHDPLGTPFWNCPTQGKDVVVPIDAIVGGPKGAGQGWQMLMESLAAGRGISLPAQTTGGTKLVARGVSAHASIRKQFGIPIGKFEGVEESLARIGAFTYLLEAMRRYTLGAIDKGIKPPVITAIAKYHSTEIGRKVVNDGMDVLGGAAISRGPRNIIAHQYIATPIGITVEGANILTRTLIIFGQGALRAHPYAFREVNALEKNDLKEFDRAFWGHIGHIVRNAFRAICLSLTRGWLVPSPTSDSTAVYFRKLAWVSASFAILADIAMGSLGGKLKLKEKITGRFADILSWMYIGTAILRRYQAEGSRKEDLPFVHFTLNHALYEIQKAFDGIFANLQVPLLTWFFKYVLRTWSNVNSLAGEPSDVHTHKIASLLLADSEQRLRITEGIFMPSNNHEAMGRLEEAFKAVKAAEAIEKRVRDAVHSKTLPKIKGHELFKAALDKNIITQKEYELVGRAEELRYDAIQVDDFSQDEYRSRSSRGSIPETEKRYINLETTSA